MTLVQLSFFGLGAFLGICAVLVWRAGSQRAINRWFAAFGLAIACWIVGIGGVHGGAFLDAWGRFSFASATLIPAAFLAFIRWYPAPSRWPGPTTTMLFVGTGLTIALLGLFTPLLVHDVIRDSAGLSRTTGALYPIFLAYFVATWIASLGVLFSKWRSQRGVARAQMQHLGAAILVSGSGAMAFNLLLPLFTGRSTYSWLGPYFSIPLVLIVGHAIIRHRLLDLRLVIGRTLAHGVAIGVVAASVLFVVDVAGRLGSIELSYDSRLIIGVVVLLLMVSSPGHRLVSRLVDSYLFRRRMDYSSALRDAAKRFSRLMPPEELCRDIQSLLTSAFVPERASVVIRTSETAPFEILGSVDASTRQLIEECLSTASTVLNGPTVLLVDDSDRFQPLHQAFAHLRTSGVEVFVFLGRRNHGLGVMLLGPRRSGDAYFKTDLEFVESLAELASVALENALLYRQRLEMLEYSQRLLESLDAAVVAVDASGSVTSLNRSAARLFSVEQRSDEIGLDDLPSEVAWALAIALRTSSQPRATELTIEHTSRGLIPVVLSTASLHDNDNHTRGALVVVTDLTAVKALEQNQRRIEHLTLMARFYAGIAHEIRSPLTSISNFVSLLNDRFDDPDYRETASRLLPLEVNRIAQLAERLRLMAPSEGGQLSNVDLGILLRDLVRLHVSRSGDPLRVTLKCPDGLPPVRGDQRQLVQLFLNLVNNASEAMPFGGEIKIDVRHIPQDRGAGGILCAQVTDEGAGIHNSIAGKVFEPFFTTKASGTGLGLSICREIAEFHRAALSIRPRGDRNGTCVEIRLPVAASWDPPEALKELSNGIADGESSERLAADRKTPSRQSR